MKKFRKSRRICEAKWSERGRGETRESRCERGTFGLQPARRIPFARIHQHIYAFSAFPRVCINHVDHRHHPPRINRPLVFSILTIDIEILLHLCVRVFSFPSRVTRNVNTVIIRNLRVTFQQLTLHKTVTKVGRN